MADGKVVIAVDADAKQAQKELDKVTKSIEKIQADLNKSTGEQSGIKAELDAAKASAKQTEDAIRSLKTEASQLTQITSGTVAVDPAQFIAAQERQAAVTAQLKEQEAALAKQDKAVEALDAKYTRVTDKVIQQTAALDDAKEKAGALTDKITNAGSASGKMAQAAAKVSESMDRFNRRIGGLFTSALVFSVISKGLSSVRDWLGKTIMKSDGARAAVARLKGALLTLAQPLLKVVIPAFVLFVNVLTRIVTAIATLVSKIFGTSYAQSAADAAAAYDDESEAIAGVGDAAKKAGKSLANFDEINQLSSNSDSSGGGASAGGGIGDGSIAPDFSAMIRDQLTSITELFVGAALLALGAILTFSGANIPLGIALMAIGALAIWDAVSDHWGEIAEVLQGQVGLITAIISGALLVIGAILVFSGANIPLGIGLMLAGAVGMAATVAANWNAIVEALQGPIGVITALLSTALLAIGAILTFSGANIPLGIGLMVAGAVGLAAVIAINWGTISKALKGPIGAVTAVVSGALLAVGAILAFSGANLALGIGLMVAGAAGLAAVIAVNWDTIQTKLQGQLSKVTAAVGAALLALGAILTFTGANIPLGLGLLVAGAAGLATTIAANWNIVQSKLQGPLGAVTAMIGAALLVLGVVLLFTGAGIPLGLGMIAAGGVSLAAAIAPNWDFIVGKVKECWTNIQKFWDKNIAPVFTADWWANLAKNALNGFIGIFEGAINGIIDGVNWLISCLNRIQIDIPDWVPLLGGKTFGINIPPVNYVALPRLASGAVIPPNREFLAVLGDQKSGTNIETPLATMVQAFKQAMNETGGMGGRQITVVMQLDHRELGRAVYNLNNEETQRVGVKLAGVKA